MLGSLTIRAEGPEGTALGLGVAASAVHVQSEKEAMTNVVSVLGSGLGFRV